MVLADRLTVPDRTAALLFDMDGVLFDTLTMEYELVRELLSAHLGEDRAVPRSVVREAFPYDLLLAWRRILSESRLELPDQEIDELVAAHEHDDSQRPFPRTRESRPSWPQLEAAGWRWRWCPTIPRPTWPASSRGPGSATAFDLIVGNDTPGLQKKPAPDTYLEAARRLSVEGSRCAVVEDSLLGAEAGHRAGCHVTPSLWPPGRTRSRSCPTRPTWLFATRTSAPATRSSSSGM